jgi:hypothetical protein
VPAIRRDSTTDILDRLSPYNERMAWALLKYGEQPERIAAKLAISPDEVLDLSQAFEIKRKMMSHEIVDVLFNIEAATGIAGSGQRLQEMQQARRFTGAYVKDGEGKDIPVFDPDHAAANEAIKTAIEMASKIRDKGNSSSINIGINNQSGINGNGVAPTKTFEQRVREKRGVLPDGDVKFLPQGKSGSAVLEGELADENDDDDDDVDSDDEDSGDEMADGTSDLEIEEADS